MTVPPWIRSRWVIVPGILLVTIALWNLYVATHDHGVVEGRVVDAGGRPVAGATVTLASIRTDPIQGMKNAMAVFMQSLEEGVVIDRPDLLVSFAELNNLMGLPDIKALEERFVGTRPAAAE